MKLLLILHFSLFILHYAATAANYTVSVDENGEIQPQPAREAIARASSAAVMIDLANAKAEVLTNVAAIAAKTVEEANDLLTKRGDYAVISFNAIGLKDAIKEGGASADEGEIRIVDVGYDDRSDPDNVLATLTWQYVLGKFSHPGCLGKSQIESTNAWEAVSMTEPVQVEWGTNVAYRATASIPKLPGQDRFFLQITAKPDAPIDDGQVFDTYTDGTDYTIRFEPSHVYEMRIISGRVTTVRLIQ